MPKELIFSITKKDFVIEWYSGTGAGGQHRNKHQNCCRIKHILSDSEVTGTESRSRDQNLKSAFKKLTELDSFKIWLKKETSQRLLTESEKEHNKKIIEKRVEQLMQPQNLKIEYI